MSVLKSKIIPGTAQHFRTEMQRLEIMWKGKWTSSNDETLEFSEVRHLITKWPQNGQFTAITQDNTLPTRTSWAVISRQITEEERESQLPAIREEFEYESIAQLEQTLKSVHKSAAIEAWERPNNTVQLDFIDAEVPYRGQLSNALTLPIGSAFEEFSDEVLKMLEEARKGTEQPIEPKTTKPVSYFIDLSRIEELQKITTSQFDLAKLVRLCEELNICYHHGCFFAVGALTRAILDHIPPIFGFETFAEVANNYGKAGKSFKECVQHLEGSSRKIADSYLHLKIRRKETLPNPTQVNFSSDLDMVLAEIVRILSSSKP